MGLRYFKFVNIINIKVTNPIENPSLINTSKSNFHTSSKIFSIINFEAITAKKIAINITDLKMIINSIIEEKIISFLKILKF